MEKMDHRQFGIQFLEMARNVSYLFIYFFFLYFISFVRMIIEPVQAYSVIRNNVVETNGGQARIRLVYVEQLSSGHFYSACGRRGITDVVYTVDRRSNKTISRQKLVKWKIILVFFRLVSFSFFRWNTSNSWNFNDRCATAQLSRAQTVDNSQLTHILCLVPVAESWQRQRERERGETWLIVIIILICCQPPAHCLHAKSILFSIQHEYFYTILFHIPIIQTKFEINVF